jgi:predicted small lipoprotein YifL|tara:strand:- start:651 stop:842 length:192 start_codon:yes stop_codon:yes gene_type:complete
MLKLIKRGLTYMKNKYLFLIICSSMLLNACGTKGALYIPEEKYPQATLQVNPKIYNQLEIKET